MDKKTKLIFLGINLVFGFDYFFYDRAAPST